MNTDKPKVSMLVPIYNVELYLRECLESLVNQTLKDIEIICINDGSTDSSPQIIQEFSLKDKRIKVINKENSGYGASMNIGLEAANGEYIGIVEADDFADSKMFEALYDIAVKNDADLVKSDFYYYLTAENQTRKAGKISKRNCGKVFNINDDPTILKIVPSIWSAIYKKEFLSNNNIKFLETPGASYQDTSFSFKTISTAKRIVFTYKGYLHYRCDNKNSSVKQKNKVFCICDEYREITKYFNEHPEIKAVANDVKLSIQFNSYKCTAAFIDKKFRNDFIDEYQREFKEFADSNEITHDFYKKVKPKELEMLLNDKKAFREYIDRLSVKQEQKAKRQKQFSIRINSSRISIILFGKQLMEIE